MAVFAGLIGLLMMSDSVDPTATDATLIRLEKAVMDDGSHGDRMHVYIIPKPENPLPTTCTENTDCPLATTYCNRGTCTDLQNPTCICSQPQVLRCYEASGRARHLYCKKGCSSVDNGIVCE